MLIFYTLLALVLLRAVVIALFVVMLLTAGPACPACGRDTIRILTRGPARWIGWIERRWCLHCGWAGWTRRGRPTASVPESVPVSSR